LKVFTAQTITTKIWTTQEVLSLYN